MNIFYLDTDPTIAARALSDKHVPKMILETCQLLCSAHHAYSSAFVGIYKATHMNHPCSLWVRASINNYIWTHYLLRALCAEYAFRFRKIHKCQAFVIDGTHHTLLERLEIAPRLPHTPFQQPPRVMPVDFHRPCVVQSYRDYYAIAKRHLHRYNKGRNAPPWISVPSNA
ncbi:MAG: hypothetical protein E6R03_01085 [Hyphomicrobiaceae bacterium]|nr:MAG: hypothetical protein E6R03_01085 [Hyphomicrobiaceae bacterium]